VVDHVPLAIEEKRSPLAEWSASIAFKLVEAQRGLFRRVRIPRVPDLIREVVIDGAAITVRSGFGEYFNPAEAELIVFGRKRILIYADLANGLFGGKLSTAESIDKDRAAA